jgi:hypothetical protein
VSSNLPPYGIILGQNQMYITVDNEKQTFAVNIYPICLLAKKLTLGD